jgi:hypothetical protein
MAALRSPGKLVEVRFRFPGSELSGKADFLSCSSAHPAVSNGRFADLLPHAEWKIFRA